MRQPGFRGLLERKLTVPSADLVRARDLKGSPNDFLVHKWYSHLSRSRHGCSVCISKIKTGEKHLHVCLTHPVDLIISRTFGIDRCMTRKYTFNFVRQVPI